MASVTNDLKRSLGFNSTAAANLYNDNVSNAENSDQHQRLIQCIVMHLNFADVKNFIKEIRYRSDFRRTSDLQNGQ